MSTTFEAGNVCGVDELELLGDYDSVGVGRGACNFIAYKYDMTFAVKEWDRTWLDILLLCASGSFCRRLEVGFSVRLPVYPNLHWLTDYLFISNFLGFRCLKISLGRIGREVVKDRWCGNPSIA